jgi:hypothetical protein
MTMKVFAKSARIKATDTLSNVAYVFHDGRVWRCSLASGMNASMWYAGLGDDVVAVRFALDDCLTASQVLETVRNLGSPRYQYELV